MKKSDATQVESASELISKRIAELGDWRGETLSRMRMLIKEADPDVLEEWKWMGTPVWSHDGIVCTGESYKKVVKLTFAKGASLKDLGRKRNREVFRSRTGPHPQLQFPLRPRNSMYRARSTILFTLALMLAGTFSSALLAQFSAKVGVGARVRVWVPEAHRQSEGPAHRQMLRGTVAAVAPDTLHLSIPGAIGTVAIPRMAVRRLQVSRGWPSRPASAFERALGGAAGGAASWAALNDPSCTRGPHYRTDWQAAGVGAAWGAGIGAVVGLVFPHEQWRRVRLRR